MASVNIGVSLVPRYDVLGYQASVEAGVIRRAASPLRPASAGRSLSEE